jgi:hypothetical protein
MELEKSAFPVSRGGGPKGVGCSDGFPIPQDNPLKTFHFTLVRMTSGMKIEERPSKGSRLDLAS